MLAALDITGLLASAVALAVSLYALVTRWRDGIRIATVCAAAAAAVLVMSNLSNALNNLGLSATLHNSEEYFEIMFPSLVLYLMYGLYSFTHRREASREHDIVDRLDQRLAHSLEEMGEHRLGMLQALSAAVDARDHYTAQHSMHVADYASALGYRLGMRERIPMFEQAGLLHDIGKIGVRDTLLLKPAKLTDEEYGEIKQHVEESAHILETVPFLAGVVPLVRHHHERWDGSGYPDGLAGADIPRESRVIAIADAFDAMTTDRPYRGALSIELARERLLECKGTQFDPEAVDAFVQLIDEGLIVLGSSDKAATN